MLEQYMKWKWPTTQNLTGTKVEGLKNPTVKNLYKELGIPLLKKEGQKDENMSAS